MRHTYLLIFLLTLPSIFLNAQNCSEYEIHRASIDSSYSPGFAVDRMDSVFNANAAFLDYTIAHLARPADSCFIANRNLLHRLDVVTCDNSKLVFEDQLKQGQTCRIELSLGEFQAAEHKIEANSAFTTIESIDGQFPHGGEYGIPKLEIQNMTIQINGQFLEVEQQAYGNFYQVNFCQNDGFYRQVEAYESLDGQFIYVYFYGGNAASTYFAKLIFDHKQFRTKIVSTYYPLSIHMSLREDFIGF